jgi:hypothetical protein
LELLEHFIEHILNSLLFVQVYLWYPLSLITGGTTAKIMLAAKDNFLGKYIYKDTLAKNLASVIYRVSSAFTEILYTRYLVLGFKSYLFQETMMVFSFSFFFGGGGGGAGLVFYY